MVSLLLSLIALASTHFEKLSTAKTKCLFPPLILVSSGSVSTLHVWKGLYPLSVGIYVVVYLGSAFLA